jgi:hypothetical protein
MLIQIWPLSEASGAWILRSGGEWAVKRSLALMYSHMVQEVVSLSVDLQATWTVALVKHFLSVRSRVPVFEDAERARRWNHMLWSWVTCVSMRNSPAFVFRVILDTVLINGSLVVDKNWAEKAWSHGFAMDKLYADSAVKDCVTNFVLLDIFDKNRCPVPALCLGLVDWCKSHFRCLQLDWLYHLLIIKNFFVVFCVVFLLDWANFLFLIWVNFFLWIQISCLKPFI